MGHRSGREVARIRHHVVVVGLCLEDGRSHDRDHRICHRILLHKHLEVGSDDGNRHRSRGDHDDRSSSRLHLEDSASELGVGSEIGSGRVGARSARQRCSGRSGP